MLNATLAKRTIPNPYNSGTSWKIEALAIRRGMISAIVRWDDGMETEGTLAPGTALWQALEMAGPLDTEGLVPTEAELAGS